MNCLGLKAERATPRLVLVAVRATDPTMVSVGLVCSVGEFAADFNNDFNNDFRI